MTERIVLLRDTYRDSVALMRISKEVAERDGVLDAAAVMGTPLNLGLLADLGFELPDAVGPNDLLVAVRAESEKEADSAVAALEARLAEWAHPGIGPGASTPAPRSVAAAARQDPALSLAFISVPRGHAAYEVASALERGLHVFCFSDGVSLVEEATLKRFAAERGVLLMGPDCGTAIVDGVALGFANAVRRGPVGVVGASGTGMQELTCLLELSGVGISHAIGVGGRDLSPEVGGIMTIRALEALAADPATGLIVVVSKPPDPAVADRMIEVAAHTSKPAVLCLLGTNEPPAGLPRDVEVTGSLEVAARIAAEWAARELVLPPDPDPGRVTPGDIRGLFTGGSLCDEAMAYVARRVGRVASNIPLRPGWALQDMGRSEGHTFIDFGDDRLTEGRPHPMIDPTLRNRRFLQEAADEAVGVMVLDVVLGFGAHQDPASELAPLVQGALDRRGATLSVVVDLCGTPGDPQDASAQAARLGQAGALVTRSAAQAARTALRAAGITDR
jgi:FdrA protein